MEGDTLNSSLKKSRLIFPLEGYWLRMKKVFSERPKGVRHLAGSLRANTGLGPTSKIRSSCVIGDVSIHGIWVLPWLEG